GGLVWGKPREGAAAAREGAVREGAEAGDRVERLAGDGTASAGARDGADMGVSSGRYSRMSPGWQSRARQIPSRVEKRMALALPFFRMERLAIVMPTRSASSVTLIFRLARITSMLTIVATDATSDREVVFC